MQAGRLPRPSGQVPVQEHLREQSNENKRKSNRSGSEQPGSVPQSPEKPGTQPIRIPGIPDKIVPPVSRPKSFPMRVQRDRDPAGTVPVKHEASEKFILIDLSKKHAIVPLQDFFPPDAEDPCVKILGLRQEGLRYDIVPPDGIVTENSVVELSFPDFPSAKLLIALKISNKKPILRISPELAFGSNKQIPFTMNQIQLLGVKANKRYSRLNAELASAKRKKQQIETWLAAPLLKPLQTRGAAQTQVMMLAQQIPEMEAIVRAARENVRFLLSCREFARQLDKKAELRWSRLKGSGADLAN